MKSGDYFTKFGSRTLHVIVTPTVEGLQTVHALDAFGFRTVIMFDSGMPVRYGDAIQRFSPGQFLLEFKEKKQAQVILKSKHPEWVKVATELRRLAVEDWHHAWHLGFSLGFIARNVLQRKKSK